MLDVAIRSGAAALPPLVDLWRDSLERTCVADLIAVALGGPRASLRVRRQAASLAAVPLWRLRALGADDLSREFRVTRSQATRVIALLELADRWSVDDRPTVSSPRDALLVLNDLRDAETERVDVLLLDARNTLIGRRTVAVGGLNAARLTPRDVLRPAITSQAVGLLIAHPHPSGNPAPSRADRAVTGALRDAAGIVGIMLLDHLIVARNGHFSFREHENWDGQGEGTAPGSGSFSA